MNDRAPFNRADLEELDERFLAAADEVIAMRDIHAGNHSNNAIGMRHDCDAGHSIVTACAMAQWEAERGYRSTYYVLHTSPYWTAPEFRDQLERIAACGHEIGIHANALAEAMRTGGDPHKILEEAIDRLRSWGHEITGVAGHGDTFCNRAAAPGEPWFANDEQFTECAERRKDQSDRMLKRGKVKYRLDPRPLASFGLEYEAIIVSGFWPRWRFSDSGGVWKHNNREPTFDEAAEIFAARPSQLQMLVHPDWWSEAFAAVEVAA